MTLSELYRECERLLTTEKIDPDVKVYTITRDVAFGELYTSEAKKIVPVVTDGNCYTFQNEKEAKENVAECMWDKIRLNKAVGIGELDDE